jgi:PAS domain S-box-containing protein
MKYSHYQSVVDQAHIGYAYNKIIPGKGRKIDGYCILEANPAFEGLTGLSLKKVKGKNIFDIYPGIVESGLDNLDCYSKIALKGGNVSFEKYSFINNKWFNIQVFSDEKDHFTTLISDITNTKAVTLNNEDLVNLSRSLLDDRNNPLDFKKFTKEICRISNADFGVFNLYSEDRKKFRNLAIYGNSKMVQATYDLLGYSLSNKEWEVSETRMDEIRSEHHVRFNSLYDLAKGVIPAQLCRSISKALNVGPVYVVEISAHLQLIGDFILFFRTGNEMLNQSMVKAFANMAGIAINRNNDEKKRQNSENNLKNFFNAGIDLHWVLDENGIILEINETVKMRLGYTEEDLIGKPVLNVHPPELREEAARIIVAMISGKDIACHIPLLTKSGHYIPVETYVIKGEWNGTPVLFGISKDVSELKLSEDKFSKAFNTSPDIIGLSTLDTGIYVEVNKAFCEILGYTQAEVIGRSSSEVLNFDSGLRKTLLNKMKKDGYLRNEEILVLTSHGKPLNLLLSAEIIRMQDKEYNLTVAIDITERKAIEESLRESEAKYRLLSERMSDILWICDLQLKPSWMSPSIERILGFTPEERMNQELIVQSPPSSLQKASQILSEQLALDPSSDPDRTITLRMEYYHKDGSIRMLENVMSFIRDKHGKPVGIHGLSRDITERNKAEEELVKANELLIQTGLMSKVGAWEVDFVNNEVYWSKVSRQIMSVPDDFVPQIDNILTFYKEGDSRDRIYSAVENARLNGVPFDDEYIVVTFDNKEHYIRNIARPVFRDGKCIKLVATFQDITDRKVNENKLRESEANLKAIIENTMENIWSVNTDYEIQYVNDVFSKAFLGTFGVALKVGMNIIKALPENLQGIWKERYDRSFQNEHFIFEDRIEVGDQQIYIEVAMNPIIVDGKVVGASLYGKDVTGKMIANLQLQYQADLRKLLVELSTSFINLPVSKIGPAVSDSLVKIGEFVGADRAYVFEYDFVNLSVSNTIEWCRAGIKRQKDSMQNVPLNDFMGWVDIHKRGESVNISDVNEVADASLRLLMEAQEIKSLLTIPLVKQGDCIGFVGFDSVRSFHNYTDYEQQLLQIYAQMLVNVKERIEKESKLVEAKEKAEETDRLKSAFLANMSHEIRTPMNGILGFLELMKEPDLSEENKANYIDIVTKSGQRLLGTLNDIMEISKIEAKELKVNFSDVDTAELMAYFSDFFRPQAEAKGLTMKLKDHLTGKASILNTDRSKLESMISNLLKNAVKFTNEGIVELGNFRKDDSVVFYVKDTGIGIAKDRIDVIFDRFVQGDNSNSRVHEGSGLGLSIVNAYTEMLNGKIWVESEVGKGSTFYFSLPYISAQGNEIKQSSGNTPTVKGESGLTVLVVEDDYAGYYFLEKILTSQNCKVFHLTDGNETVKFVKEHNFEGIILMDLKIPGITGLEATRQIREFNKDIPIVAQTAYAFDSDRQEAIAAGCSDYLSKPVSRHDLVKIIQKYSG